MSLIPSRISARGIVKRNYRLGISNPYRVTKYMRKLSHSHNDEWYVSGYEMSDEECRHCTCGHCISQQYYLTNMSTGRTLLLGCECVKKLGDFSSEMARAKLGYDMRTSIVYHRVKFDSNVSRDHPRYRFKVRYGSMLYRLIEDLDDSNDYVYKPWFFEGRDCYITVGHRYSRYYRHGWYRIPLSLYETDTTAGKYISFKYI